MPRITLLGRPGCHLCDEARMVISKVADDLGVAWEERDITQSAADLREYWEKIPVTLVDGVQHDFWRVSEDRLRRALKLPVRSRGDAPDVRAVGPDRKNRDLIRSGRSDKSRKEGGPARGACVLCAFVHKRRMVDRSRTQYAPP